MDAGVWVAHQNDAEHVDAVPCKRSAVNKSIWSNMDNSDDSKATKVSRILATINIPMCSCKVGSSFLHAPSFHS